MYYEYFVKKALCLVRPGGCHSFIVPDRLGFNEQFTDFRRELASSTKIVSLLYKAHFPKVIVDTLIYVLMPNTSPAANIVEIGEFHSERLLIEQHKLLRFPSCQFLALPPLIEKLYYDLPSVRPLSTVVSTRAISI